MNPIYSLGLTKPIVLRYFSALHLLCLLLYVPHHINVALGLKKFSFALPISNFTETDFLSIIATIISKYNAVDKPVGIKTD